MAELRISEGLEKFQKPSTLPRYVVVLFLRLYSIPKVLLEKNPVDMPRTFVDKGDIMMNVVKDMIERIKGSGECMSILDCFEWKEGAEMGTDYIFVNGSKIQAAKEYEWYHLIEYEVPGLPSGREGREVFSQMCLKAGHGWPGTLL